MSRDYEQAAEDFVMAWFAMMLGDECLKKIRVYRSIDEYADSGEKPESGNVSLSDAWRYYPGTFRMFHNVQARDPINAPLSIDKLNRLLLPQFRAKAGRTNPDMAGFARYRLRVVI
jgi:hypothetical protein